MSLCRGLPQRLIELHNDYDDDSLDENSSDDDSLDTWSQKSRESSIDSLGDNLDIGTEPKQCQHQSAVSTTTCRWHPSRPSGKMKHLEGRRRYFDQHGGHLLRENWHQVRSTSCLLSFSKYVLNTGFVFHRCNQMCSSWAHDDATAMEADPMELTYQLVSQPCCRTSQKVEPDYIKKHACGQNDLRCRKDR